MEARPRLSHPPAAAPHELRRARLLDALHANWGRPLVLVWAPAGFGKSTLAAGYARESTASVAWLPVEGFDSDPRVLFGRVQEALEGALHRIPAAPQLQRGLTDGADAVGMAHLLAADLQQLDRNVILVLDDFHAVHNHKEVLHAIDVLLRNLPDRCQIVITDREPPPLSMDRLVARNAVFALSGDDLRFTRDEAGALRQLLGGDASHDADAEGWVAGILLGGAPRQLGVSGGTVLAAYVDREVLARLSRTEQRWLELLAVLETITSRAAERLIGIGPWASRLATLAERCPFLVAREDRAYHLHGLVRESLLSRLRARSAAQANRAWAVAREIALEAGDAGSYVRACRELGELEAAAALVEKAAADAARGGRWATALAALDLLPEALRRAHAPLSLAEVHPCLESGLPDRARKAAESALALGGRVGDVVVQISAILELASIDRWTGELDGADEWVATAEQLLAQHAPALREEWQLRGRVAMLRGVCLSMRGQHAQARETFEAAQILLEQHGVSREYAMVLGNLGKLCSRMGDYACAQRALSAASRNWRLLGDQTSMLMAQTILGNLYLRTGKFEMAGSVLTSALDSARQIGAVRAEAYLVDSVGGWHRASGRRAEAATHFQDAVRLGEELGERELLVSALVQRAEIAVLDDETSVAREHLDRVRIEVRPLGDTLELAALERALGRLHLAEGRPQQALSCFDAALQRGGTTWGPDERVTCLYWLGTAYLNLGLAWQAQEAMRQALELLDQVGSAAPLAMAAAEDPRLLRRARQAGLDPITLGAVERQVALRTSLVGAAGNNEAEADSSEQVATGLPRIEARLFGKFRLLRDGVLVNAGSRRVDRSGELFALLVLHPDGLAAREIASLLWPGMTVKRGQHNLRMTAYLLRRLLGDKASLRYVAEAYQLEPQFDLWADVRAFDKAIARAHLASGEPPVQALEEALALRQGSLLADVDSEWVDTFRMAYDDRYVAAALRLSELTSGTDPRRSDALAEQVLALEPDNEDAHERLIRNAQARRDHSSLRRAIRRYEQAMAAVGLQPNPSVVRAGVPAHT
jgi:LuxR family transcriptional regulator, maltose regulon positive regulatory protein